MPLNVIRSLSQQGLLVRESSEMVIEKPDGIKGQKEHLHVLEEKLELVCE